MDLFPRDRPPPPPAPVPKRGVVAGGGGLGWLWGLGHFRTEKVGTSLILLLRRHWQRAAMPLGFVNLVLRYALLNFEGPGWLACAD